MNPFADPARRPFHEFERTWAVSVTPRLRSLLDVPWMLVQAYFDDVDSGFEHSLRSIPSRGLLVERYKTITYNGDRMKISVFEDYEKRLDDVRAAPRIAIKSRHLVCDGDRFWLVDYFPWANTWVVESEFETFQDMKAYKVPTSIDWIGEEMTGNSRGYTRNRAYPLESWRLERHILDAAKHGSTAVYLPGEENFSWSSIKVRKQG